jgi:cysteine desulfurase
MTGQVYLDFNATAPARPEVVDALARIMGEGGNASSVHATGREARRHVEEARAAVAALVGAPADSVIFTASGTESNNQALRCAGRDRVIVSTIEHESVHLARTDAVLAPVASAGLVDLGALEELLAAEDTDSTPALVSVMYANNETGIIQPVAEIAALAHRFGALVHCDAVQAAGKVALDMTALGIDFMTISAHKLAGPQGVGALVVRDRGTVARFVHGGGQERGLRAGTENVPGIAGFGIAAALAHKALGDFATLGALRDDLERRVREIAPDITVIGAGEARLPNTAKFATPGLSSETQVMGLDLAGVAISAGSACSAGKVEAPYVLTAMGMADELATCAIRVSLGWSTTADHIDAFIDAWRGVFERARGRTVAAAV